MSGSGAETPAAAVLNREEMDICLRQTVGQGQELQLWVTGYSMAPLLRHQKDRVSLVSPDLCGIKRLDIVLFCRRDGKYVLHRIIQCLPGDIYVVNGDAQLWTEEISREQIRAVVKSINRESRSINCLGRLYRCFAWLWVWLKPVRSTGIGLYHWWKR